MFNSKFYTKYKKTEIQNVHIINIFDISGEIMFIYIFRYLDIQGGEEKVDKGGQLRQ